MDIVYIVRNGDDNEDLRISLRSIAKFAPKFDNIWISGYKPNWVADNVGWINTHITNVNWAGARTNLIEVCKCNKLSKNIILMNDDFIATRPIHNWNKSLSKILGTFEEQMEEFKKDHMISDYTRGFENCLNLIRRLTKRQIVNNYESHLPMIINRSNMLKLFENPIIESFMRNNVVTLYRSLYGNVYDIKFSDVIKDVKFRNTDPISINTEWISVFDNWIGNDRDFPYLNRFIKELFPDKCKYEK